MGFMTQQSILTPHESLLATNTVAEPCKMVYLFFSTENPKISLFEHVHVVSIQGESGLPGMPIMSLSSTQGTLNNITMQGSLGVRL